MYRVTFTMTDEISKSRAMNVMQRVLKCSEDQAWSFVRNGAAETYGPGRANYLVQELRAIGCDVHATCITGSQADPPPVSHQVTTVTFMPSRDAIPARACQAVREIMGFDRSLVVSLVEKRRIVVESPEQASFLTDALRAAGYWVHVDGVQASREQRLIAYRQALLVDFMGAESSPSIRVSFQQARDEHAQEKWYAAITEHIEAAAQAMLAAEKG